uniref:Ribosomal protein S10 n=1 Tax=Trebouxia lynnae TaxID=1825957 RepID=A0A5J6DTJ1_9CHLO|nr:ribosomal protein S10 [Trebouxia lynnae]
MTYRVSIYFKSFDNLYIHTSINKISIIKNYLDKKGKTNSLELLKKNQYSFFLLNKQKIKSAPKMINLPTLKKKFTVLRSPHIDKKSREQFEWTRYKKSLFLYFQNTSVLSLFLFLLKNSSFPGVQIEINIKHSTFCNPLQNTKRALLYFAPSRV